jgi:glycine cleavage system H protein
MFPPCQGQIVRFNPELLRDPSGINADYYNQGWLYEFIPGAPLLSPQEYIQFLGSAWEDAQRTIKGQMNEG